MGSRGAAQAAFAPITINPRSVIPKDSACDRLKERIGDVRELVHRIHRWAGRLLSSVIAEVGEPRCVGDMTQVVEAMTEEILKETILFVYDERRGRR